MTVRDCHVDGWTGPAAINLSGTLQVHDSTFTNPQMPGAVAVSHIAADDDVGRAEGRVQNWPVMLSNNTIRPDKGPRFNSSVCAELSPPAVNSTEVMECGGASYGCDPSCDISDFHCDRNTTGTPCKPTDMCAPPHPGGNQVCTCLSLSLSLCVCVCVCLPLTLGRGWKPERVSALRHLSSDPDAHLLLWAVQLYRHQPPYSQRIGTRI